MLGSCHFCADFIFMQKVYNPCLKDAAYKIPLYLDYWFMRRRAFNIFPYISLCEMKRPLVGLFLGGFYFYAQTMSQGCCIYISGYLECQFMRRRFFYTPNFTLFAPYWAPIVATP